MLPVSPPLSPTALRPPRPDAGERVQQLDRCRPERVTPAVHLLPEPRFRALARRFPWLILVAQLTYNPPVGGGDPPRQGVLHLGLLARAGPAGPGTPLLGGGRARP